MQPKRITHGKWSNYFTETTLKLTQHPIICIVVLHILTDQSFYNQCDPVSIFFLLLVHLNATYFFTFHTFHNQIWYVRKYVTLTYKDVISVWFLEFGYVFRVEYLAHGLRESKMATSKDEYIFVACCMLNEWEMATQDTSGVKLGVFYPRCSWASWLVEYTASLVTHMCLLSNMNPHACTTPRDLIVSWVRMSDTHTHLLSI